jgi:hypothetical protein
MGREGIGDVAGPVVVGYIFLTEALAFLDDDTDHACKPTLARCEDWEKSTRRVGRGKGRKDDPSPLTIEIDSRGGGSRVVGHVDNRSRQFRIGLQ